MSAPLFVCNMNNIDRISRFMIGGLFVLLSPLVSGFFSESIFSWFIGIFGLTNMISALIGWCFMYSFIGLSSTSKKDESFDELIDIDFGMMRRRIMLGFGAVATLVIALFISESYTSTVKAVKQVEYARAIDITRVISSEVNTLSDFETLSDNNAGVFKLNDILNQLKKPAYLSLIYTGKAFSSSHLLDEKTVDEITQNIARGVVNKENPVTFININEITYFIAEQAIDINQSNEKATVIIALPAASAHVVNTELLPRLTGSSLIVFWLTLWGSVGVAFFTWQYVERSNRIALNAARTDSLTGLSNELALKEIFRDRIDHSSKEYLITAVNFRNMRMIATNNSSSTVNLILKKVAQKLKDNLKSGCYLARLNDGNFLLAVATSEHSADIHETFSTIVNETIDVDDYQFSLDPTEAIIYYPKDVKTFKELMLSISSLIMAAEHNRVSKIYYDKSYIVSSAKALEYATRIKCALDNFELELFLQPKVDINSGKVIGAETLIRWNHPTDGLLPPSKFINVIEKSNFREEFSRYVIQETVKLRRDLGNQDLGLPISFNLNAYDIVNDDIRALLAEISQSPDFKPHCLELELTETETTINVDKISDALNDISKMGFNIALDDFGTGMSSLSFTHKLPINTIKIDKSFVDELSDEKRTHIAVKTIVDLAEQYQCKIIVEGVETEQQVNILKKLGCNVVQGYYFAKPMTKNAFIKFVSAKNT